MRNDDKLIAAHQHCANHRDEVLASAWCGCFACLKRFAPSAIDDWLEAEGAAICPNCSVDAVIGDRSGYPVNATFLAEMKRIWFDDSAG